MKKIKNHCVSRVGGSKPKVATPEVVNKIEALKREKHDMFAWEIREKLIDSKLCPPSQCPSISSINRILRKRAAERAAERAATDNTFHKGKPNLSHSQLNYTKDFFLKKELSSLFPVNNHLYSDKTTKIYPQIYENLKYMHNCYYPHQNNCINCMNYNFVNAGICAPPLLPISELRGDVNNAQSKIGDIFQRDRQISKDDLQERTKLVYSCTCLDCIKFRSEKALKLTPLYKNDSFYNMFSVQEFQDNTSYRLGMNERKKAHVAYTGNCFKQLEETYKYFHCSNLNIKDDLQKRNEIRVHANPKNLIPCKNAHV